ncbi:MAG: hypothetical protein WC966_09970 [Bradymonadales bacterium]
MSEITSLVDILKNEEEREIILDDACTLLDSEIHSKKGFKGAVIKSAYLFIKTFRKNYIPHIMNLVIDDLALAIDPIHAQYREDPDIEPFVEILCRHEELASKNMLEAMDRRIKVANEIVQKIYFRFRPQAHEHIVDALPALAKLIDKHTIEQGKAS